MVEIRRMERDDIARVAEIERLCFADPWSERAFEFLLDGKNIGFVALVDGVSAAYAGLICVLDEGQIANVAVHPDYRRQGLAREILNTVDAYSVENGIVLLSLEVRASNTAARALYESLGWQSVGIRKGFYSHPTEDAIIMIKDFLKGN